ncbi:MAG: hypothetical protein QOF83_4320 [Solirubrobacteraceae bacterium]|jgi:hypothetical protein|nr:hypothetical protein [Solirubrobacteraceae bacterium]
MAGRGTGSARPGGGAANAEPSTGRVPCDADQFSLGRAAGRLPEVRVIEAQKFTGSYPTVILADGEQGVTCRLLGPEEQPPPDAMQA